jgi:hypothetical protein
MRHFNRTSGRVIAFIFGICSFASILANALPASEQKAIAAAAATGAVQDAAKKGFPLTSSSTDVTGSVSVEATLIPASIARTVFGKEVANNYAVISLTITNRSSADSFIVNSVFVDYSHWLLSGSSKQSSYVLCLDSKTGGSEAKTQKEETAKQPPAPSGEAAETCEGNLLRPWQQQTLPNQISTVETRIVRGELLDRQPWTTRNWVLRALQAVGSVAAGFTFATTNDSWIRGIGAYNGNFIPAAQTFWPDATVAQMNRISDFGFQVNKVIAKQSSDIVVAFFPIERFLTPGLRELFLKSPSVFFSPYGMMLDPKRPSLIDEILQPIFGSDDRKSLFLKQLPNIVARGCPKNKTVGTPTPGAATNPGPATDTAAMSLEDACNIAQLLDRTSLNAVRVIVGGTMTVDVNKVPPQISEINVEVPAGKDEGSMWVKGATVTGVIRGSFLGGATPAITKPENIPVAAVAKDSSDTELHFTMTLKADLAAGTTLTFEVSKKSDGATIKSATHDYTIPKPSSTPGATTTEAKPQPVAPVVAPPTPENPKPAPPKK